MPVRVIKYVKCQPQDLTQKRHLMKANVTLKMDLMQVMENPIYTGLTNKKN